MSDAVLNALLASLPVGDGSGWTWTNGGKGDIIVTQHWMEWTGMGSEPAREIMFIGPRDLAFIWLCRKVNQD
jgi:hypothetical protein